MSIQKRNMVWGKVFCLRSIIILTIMFLIYIAISRPSPQQLMFNGKTMGTTYSVKYWSNKNLPINQLTAEVNQKLIKINKYVSTWDKQSEISAFNRLSNTKWFKADQFLIQMSQLAKTICHKTNGALDITIAPLIDAWGFDAKGRIVQSPTDAQINKIKPFIGCDKIEVTFDTNSIKKNDPKVIINLSSIAKGGGVDEVGKVLEQHNIINYLIEIGGEMKAKGKHINGNAWRIGIESPDNSNNSINNVIELNNLSIATSGDYRNFFEENGVRYSHIINPKTGKPIKHNLASVSVIANDTATADGWATALFVMGAKSALAIAKKEKIKILMIIRKEDKFSIITSPEWIKAYGNK